MLNSGRRGKRTADGSGILNVNEQFNQTNYAVPTITSYAVVDGSYVPYDDTALNTAGGQSVVIYGSGFKSGIFVSINGSNITTTLLDSNRLLITSPVLSSGSYTIYASNSNGATAIYLPGLIYSGTPTWSTGTSLTGGVERSNVSQTLSATSDSTVTYSLAAGSTLPSGVSLNSSTGELTGTLPVESGSTTYQFTVLATDAELQDTSRQFSLTVNTDTVTWSSPSPNYVISSYEYVAIPSTTAIATSAGQGSSVLYSSNVLPSGVTLNANTGAISGTITTVGNTYPRLTATANVTNRSATRDVIFECKEDIVTWSNPSSNTDYTLPKDVAMSSITLGAASAAGFDVSYAANALPTGVSLTSGVISGTPSATETVYTKLTATAATTNRANYRYITWTVSVSNDTYWKNTTLLLNTNTINPQFINDASLNNAQLSALGDTKQSNFNPYNEGYYSVQFNGTVNDYISIPHNSGLSIMSGSANTFVAECWVNWTTVTANQCIMDKSGRNGVSFQNWAIQLDASKQIKLVWGASGSPGSSAIGAISTTTIPVPGTWYHIAFVKSNADWSVFVNGTRGVTFNGLNTSNDANPAALRIGLGIDAEYNGVYMNGYISNVRVYNGPAANAPYSATSTSITVPTSPVGIAPYIHTITNQSPLLLDKSTVASTVTAGSGAKISSVQPFQTSSTAAYNTQYSAYFDGSSGDYLTVPNATNLEPGTGDFTYEFWFRQSNTTGIQELLTKGFGVQIYSNGGALSAAFSATNNSTYYIHTGFGTLLTETWNHIAVVRSGNNYYGYLNGTRTTLGTSSSSPNTGTDLVYIGSLATSYYTYGTISNVRFVKGTAVYTAATITVPTSALTAISGTQLLTCQDATFKDNSTNNYTVSSVLKAKPVAVSPFTMTTSNTTVTSLGSAYFDGTGDYINAGSGGQFDLSGNFTFECWVYGSASSWTGGDSSGYTMLVDTRNQSNTTEATRLAIGINNTGSYPYFFNGTGVTATSTIPVSVGVWNHIAVSRSGTTLKIFVNGVQGASATESTSFTTSRWCMGMGASTAGTTNSRFGLIGYIADARLIKGTSLYNSNFLPPQTPLTPVTNTQLLTLQYNGGANNNVFVDESGLNTNITRTGNVTQGTFSPFSQNGWSHYFDGTGDELSIASNTAFNLGAGNFTIEMWVNLQTVTKQGQYFFYCTGYNPNMFLWDNGYVYLRTAETGGEIVTATASGLTVNTWSHVACVRSGNTYSIYINGSLLVSGTSTGVTNGNSEMYFGKNLQGYISNFRVVKGTALYTSNFTPSTTPLTAIANTSLLTCQDNRTVDNSPNNFTITKSGDVATQAYSPFGGVTSVPTSYSNYFDGTGDYLTINNVNFASNPFTIEGWFYPTTLDVGRNFWGMDNGSGSSPKILMYVDSSSRLTIDFGNAGTTQFPIAASLSTYGIVVNQWYHIAVVRSDLTSTGFKLYINGINVGTGQVGTNLSGITANFNIGYIGEAYGSTFVGHISNFRIVNGTAIYTTNFTPSTTPLTTISQGATANQVSLLTCQSNTMVDNSTNKFTITVSGDVKPRPFNPFGITNTNPVSYTPSVNGGSMYFDGTGDYLTAGTFAPGTNNFTLEYWVYPTALPSSGVQAVTFGTLWGGGNFQMFINSDATIQWQAYSQASATASIKVNQWTHVSVVRNSGVGYFYLNGVLQGTATLTNNITGSSVYVGSRGAEGLYFTGYITGLKTNIGSTIYTSNFYPSSSPATPTTTTGTTTYSSNLLLNGTSGGIIDYHGSNNLETVNNVQLAPEDPYAGSYYSNYFDGTGDYLTVPASSNWDFGTGDFTIEGWINQSSITAADQVIAFHGWSGSGGFNYGWNLRTIATTGVLGFSVPTTGIDQRQFTDLIVKAGRWHHVAICCTSGVVSAYLDGVKSATTYSGASFVARPTTTMVLGGWNNNNENIAERLFYAGYVSNFRVVKGTALYSATFTPPTSPLTAITNTQALLCQSNTFKDNSSNAAVVTRVGDIKIKSMNPFQNNTTNSLYFDGASKLTIPASQNWVFGTGNFSIDFWLNTTDTAAGLITPATGGAGYWAVLIYAGSLYWQSAYNATNLKTASLSGYLNSSWVHISIIRSSGTLRFYFNGVEQGTGTTDTTNYSGVVNTLTIGYDGSNNGYYTGYMKDLRITKGGVARTAQLPTTPYKDK